MCSKKSEIRDYAKYAANFFWKHLKYVITPITEPIFFGKHLKYVITPITEPIFLGKHLKYVITPITGLKKCRQQP